jgi:hypothetical protein
MIQALIGPATELIGKFVEDKDQKNKLAHEIATMAERHAQELAKGQLAIDVITAYLGYETPTYPAFDMDTLMTVLLGMLGLGGMRSFEKYKKLTK